MKNEPFPKLDADIDNFFSGEIRSFTWNSEGEVWAITYNHGFEPGKLIKVATAKSWEEAYTLSELLNRFRKVREAVDSALVNDKLEPKTFEILRLVTMLDKDIDTTDIPEVTDFSKAEVGKFYRGKHATE
jgi:hypothetical protein